MEIFLYILQLNQFCSTTDDFYHDIFQNCWDFVNLFCSIRGVRIGYAEKRVTPYMHPLLYVPMFIKTSNNFGQFTGQGIEKNNDEQGSQ